MQIFDYSDKDIFILGDLHGEFKKLLSFFRHLNGSTEQQEHSRRRRIRRNGKEIDDHKNTCFVVCGDCGFGFHKPKYYEEILIKLQELLENQNNVIIFVRGNHDDPSYFNTELHGFAFNNIKFSNDYSVLLTKENTTLCIGGAISIDRAWRKENHKNVNRFTHKPKSIIYWEDEAINTEINIVKELEANNIKIDSIISHAFPIDQTEYVKEYIDNEWLIEDIELQNDVKAEWLYLFDLYNQLNTASNILWWAFGHYHTVIHSSHKNTQLFGLCPFDITGMPTYNDLSYFLSHGILCNPSELDGEMSEPMDIEDDIFEEDDDMF